MRRRGVLAGVAGSLVVGVAGCLDSDDSDPIPEPEATPGAVEGSLDLDALESRLLAELAGGSVRIDVEQSAIDLGLVRSETVEEHRHVVTIDGDREIGTYLSARELEGGIGDDPKAAGDVDESYHGDGTTYRRGSIGDDPSMTVTEASFSTFLEGLSAEATPLRTAADGVSFDDPTWSESEGVYIARGTEIDSGAMRSGWTFDSSEIHVDDDGLIARGTAAVTTAEGVEIETRIDVTSSADIDVVEPDWVPETIHEQSITIGMDHPMLTFHYEQGVDAENHLVVPANTLVEFDRTGAYSYHETIGVSELHLQIDLDPGVDDTTERFFSADDIGSYAGESFMLTPDDVRFQLDVVRADEFEDWLAE